MLFMCPVMSSVCASFSAEKIFENGTLVSIGEYLSSNNLRVLEL